MKKLILVSIIAISSIFNISGQIITGITNAGGNFGSGSIYLYDPVTGKDSLLFNVAANGTKSILLGNPKGNLIQAGGLLYGMGYIGGNYNLGGIFSYDPINQKDSLIISFSNSTESQPVGSLVLATNGLLYGTTTAGGTNNAGVIFCFNPATGKDSVVFNFDGNILYYPGSSLMQASDGLLYGMTGGGISNGTLFSFNPITGKDSIRFYLNDSTGEQPNGALIQASNGLFYGTMSLKGRYGFGTMFCFNATTGRDSILLNFNNSIGSNPNGSLIQASNGLLYGMTADGGSSGDGVIFAYNPVTGKDSTLLQLNSPNGKVPCGSLIQASDGLLYGMTLWGGAYNEGVVFRYNPISGQDTILVNLSGCQNGSNPYGDLFQASNGFLYGMTSAGGGTGSGVLFRLNRTSLQDSLLLNFGINPAQTENSPIQASDGMVYGMTYSDGTFDQGTLFKYNPSTGKDTVLINFNGTNGSNPNGSLIQASNGLLYGLTSAAEGFGNLFSYNPITYKDSLLITFNGTNGENPLGSLIQASDGLLYGTTAGNSGINAHGVLFSYNPINGKDSILYHFNDTMGAYPLGTLTEGANKILYGTTYMGGECSDGGVLFSYDIITAKYDTVISLNNNYRSPQGNLIIDTATHVIYGVSTTGGSDWNGSLFSYNLNTKTLNTLISFSGANGISPTGVLMWDTAAHNIYSTTYNGGTNNYGVLFRYNTVTQQDTILYSFQDSLLLSHRRIAHGQSHNSKIGVSPSGLMLMSHHPLAINNVTTKQNVISVYPNPLLVSTTVVFDNAGKHYLELDDVTGRKLRTIECTGTLYELDRVGLAAGVYFIKTNDEGKNAFATTKIVVE